MFWRYILRVLYDIYHTGIDNNSFLIHFTSSSFVFELKLISPLKNRIMKSDTQIQKDVMAQLNWEPILNTAQIGVSVNQGVVTLTGMVDSFTKKTTAERAAKKVAGVKAVAEDIQVGPSPAYNKTDTEIAEAILNALKWHSAVMEDRIKIKVEKGYVTLEGDVEWDFQRTAAKAAIENLTGIKMIYNLIAVKPKVTVADLKSKIKAALQRSALLDANSIEVEMVGSKVILSGTVHSIKEKEDAESAAWMAPGISSVENRIAIQFSEYAF
jgi:osmotically-inducible protein OsmY